MAELKQGHKKGEVLIIIPGHILYHQEMLMEKTGRLTIILTELTQIIPAKLNLEALIMDKTIEKTIEIKESLMSWRKILTSMDTKNTKCRKRTGRMI